MPRLISCAHTIPAILDQTKTVTRRLGWWQDRNGRRLVVPGDRLTLCGQIMGRQPGQPITRYATVEIVDVRRERLEAITDDDVVREGVAAQVLTWAGLQGHGPDIPLRDAFTLWYVDVFGLPRFREITRIEWAWDGAVLHDGMTA